MYKYASKIHDRITLELSYCLLLLWGSYNSYVDTHECAVRSVSKRTRISTRYLPDANIVYVCIIMYLYINYLHINIVYTYIIKDNIYGIRHVKWQMINIGVGKKTTVMCRMTREPDPFLVPACNYPLVWTLYMDVHSIYI